MSTGREKERFSYLLPAWALNHILGIVGNALIVAIATSPVLLLSDWQFPGSLSFIVTAAFGLALYMGTRFTTIQWSDPERAKNIATAPEHSILGVGLLLFISVLILNSLAIVSTGIALGVATISEFGLITALCYPFIDINIARRLGVSPGLLVPYIALFLLRRVEPTGEVDPTLFTELIGRKPKLT